MGQKVHPNLFRLGVVKDWQATWYVGKHDFQATLQKDIKVRAYLAKMLSKASVSRIDIERPAKSILVTVHSSRPGLVIGKKGEDVERIKKGIYLAAGVPAQLKVVEVKRPDLEAKLVSDGVAGQLEKRVLFRRAMKRAMQNAMRAGAKGIKIRVSGRLNGAEIARCEWYREGRIPLHTLRADIDYGESIARTGYGVIGVKVWIYKGEILAKASKHLSKEAEQTQSDKLEAPSSKSAAYQAKKDQRREVR